MVTLTPANAPVETPLDVRVANPLAFMVQKFLIQDRRGAKKRAQDILYIFDTLNLFGGQIEAFQRMWNEVIGPALGRSRDDVIKLSESTFSTVTDDFREAAKIPPDRTLTPDEIQSVCKYGFELIIER